MTFQVGHIVNKVYTSRTYYLYEDERPEVWLVDCGDVDVLVRELESQKGSKFTIVGVLLTHAHYDHIYGLPSLKELYPSVMVYTNGIGRKTLESNKLNMSKYHEDPIVFESENVELCEDGTEIELFEGVKAKVHFTPGHNPSCLTYEVGDYLFTGDSYIPGIKVVTNLPGGEKQLALESVEMIMQLAEGKEICSGHEVEKA